MDSSLRSEWRYSSVILLALKRFRWTVIVGRNLKALKQDFSQVMTLEMTIDGMTMLCGNGFFATFRMTALDYRFFVSS